jgi:flagellar hook-basal body complex protein FliE
MAVGGVGGVGGIDLSQLAQLYRQQVIGSASGVDPAAGAAASGSIGSAGLVDPGTAARGTDFAGAVGQSLQQLGALDQTAATKAVQAATGNLTDIHDYVIAATQAQTATELTTTVRNKALDAFNEVMRMPL